ncbi:MAG TPA: ABC transporter permease [Thermoanaerobaculia bacterium]|nr:ABC transporter permease [Thermoanaerobaculia bacterium]
MSEAATDERPLVEIAPTKGWRALDLAEMFRFRELLGVLVWRDVKVRYRQTLLGVLWVVAQPLMTMAIFTILMNRVAGIQADGGVPYPVFILSGLVPWTFFSTAVAAASNSLLGSSHLISKVYFPRMIIPASAVMGGLVDLVVTLVLVGILCIWYGTGFGASLLLLPLIALLTTALAFGCGLWLSSLNVEYRDIRVIIPFVLQIWMYATPVAYPARVLPEEIRAIVRANPMTGLVESFRAAILGTPLPWRALGYSTLVAAIIVITGAFYFRRVERQFADLL